MSECQAPDLAKILRKDREEFGSTGTCHRFDSRRLVGNNVLGM